MQCFTGSRGRDRAALELSSNARGTSGSADALSRCQGRACASGRVHRSVCQVRLPACSHRPPCKAPQHEHVSAGSLQGLATAAFPSRIVHCAACVCRGLKDLPARFALTARLFLQVSCCTCSGTLPQAAHCMGTYTAVLGSGSALCIAHTVVCRCRGLPPPSAAELPLQAP